MKTIFKYLLIAVLGISLVINFTSCSDDDDVKTKIEEEKEVEVAEVKVSPETAEVVVESTIQLTQVVLPGDAVDKTVVWESSDATLASVDATGMVTTHKAGSVVITAKTANGVKGTSIITITEKPDPNAFIDKDGRVYQTALINGKYWMVENLAYLPKVTTSDDVSADEARYYVYDYSGTDVAKAKEQEGYAKYGALYNMQAALDACPEGWHLPTEKEWKELEISIGMDPLEVDKIGLEYYTGYYRGDSDIAYSLMTVGAWGTVPTTNTTGFSAMPAGINDAGFSFRGKVTHFWSCTGKNKESFFRGLVCFGGANGVMRNFAPNESGFSVRYVKGAAEDNTYIPVESVKVTPSEVTLEIGETANLAYAILPEDATDKSVQYSSIGDEVATVDENGVITAVGPGMVSIVVTSLDNTSLRSICMVTVKAKEDPNNIPEDMVGTWKAFDVNETIMGQLYEGTDAFDYDPDAPYTSDQMAPIHAEYKGRFVFTFNADNTASVVYTPKGGTASTIAGVMTLKDAEQLIYTGAFESEDEDIKSIEVRLDRKYETDHRIRMYINSLNSSDANCVELLFRRQ